MIRQTLKRWISGDAATLADAVIEETIAYDAIDPAARPAVDLALSVRLARERNRAASRTADRIEEDAARAAKRVPTPRDCNAWARLFGEDA